VGIGNGQLEEIGANRYIQWRLKPFRRDGARGRPGVSREGVKGGIENKNACRPQRLNAAKAPAGLI
jgi:hypothetical protein